MDIEKYLNATIAVFLIAVIFILIIAAVVYKPPPVILDEPLEVTVLPAVEEVQIIEIKEPEFIPNKCLPLSEDLQIHTYNVSLEHSIDYKLLLVLIEQESQFDINAVNYNSNGTYDSGLCQINSCNFPAAEQLGYNLDCPYDNIEYACLLISKLLEKYDLELALAAYNAGEAGMLKGYGLEYAKIILDKLEESYE